MMVGNRKSEEVVDPKLPEMPSSKALKRVLLVALRCVDPDAQKRPKMGHIIHMLEADDLLVRDVCIKVPFFPLSNSNQDYSSVNLSLSTICRNVVLGEKENRLIPTVTTSKTIKLVPSWPENNMVMEHQILVKEIVVETIICQLVGDKFKNEYI